MKLSEAIKLANARQDAQAEQLTLSVACGFEPLHMKTFLLAYIRKRHHGRNVKINFGLYGNIIGTLRGLAEWSQSPIVVILEWSDLDPRLGFREGAVVAGAVNDILTSVAEQANRLHRLITIIANKTKVVFAPPSTPLPAHFHAGNGEVSTIVASLRSIMASLLDELGQHRNVHLLEIDSLTPVDGKFSLRMMLSTGFPFTLEWAALLAESIVNRLYAVPLKKGIITDLDNTLWRGVLGDDGVKGVHWSVDKNSQNHALYQQLLAILAEQGVLVGIASKNEIQNVNEALLRPDLILTKDTVYPIKASWERKSLAVAEILATWNILADSVVFVDDSIMELEEVKVRFPDITCMQFPTEDADLQQAFLMELREQFEYRIPHKEDKLRANSLRVNEKFSNQASLSLEEDYESFLSSCQPKIEFKFEKQGCNSRAFELVNKTNQFNMNGMRYLEGDWNELLYSLDVFQLSISYEDKFGPLGTIGVVIGREGETELEILSWVMSCRAFGRRIEYQTLAALFHKFSRDSIKLNFQKTKKNVPFCNFLELLLKAPPNHDISIEESKFKKLHPPLYHHIEFI